MQIKTVGKKRILYVMAAQAEYGPHLRSRFAPLITGIGPVEAAAGLSAALAALAASNTLPDCVINPGSAGSSTLPQTGVFQISSASYRDMDASALGFEKGETPFLELPATINLHTRVPGIPEASIATGATIVSGKGYEAIAADMVDMETFALLRACMMHDIPLIGLRSVSDGAEDVNHIDDWTRYLHVIDEKLALAVDQVEAAIASGSLL